MTMSPMLWGAGLACALGGAIAGNALGSTPPLDRSTIAMLYQTHETTEGMSAEGERPPDHYPLVTRNGTVPVGELAMRGLYSQRRYQAYLYAADYAPAEAVYEDYQPGEEWRDERTREALAAADAANHSEFAADAEKEAVLPLQLAAGPATVSPEGNAKLIDVQATLAMR